MPGSLDPGIFEALVQIKNDHFPDNPRPAVYCTTVARSRSLEYQRQSLSCRLKSQQPFPLLPVVRAVETKLMQAPTAPQTVANGRSLSREEYQSEWPLFLKYLIQKAYSKNPNTTQASASCQSPQDNAPPPHFQHHPPAPSPSNRGNPLRTDLPLSCIQAMSHKGFQFFSTESDS